MALPHGKIICMMSDFTPKTWEPEGYDNIMENLQCNVQQSGGHF